MLVRRSSGRERGVRACFANETFQFATVALTSPTLFRLSPSTRPSLPCARPCGSGVSTVARRAMGVASTGGQLYTAVLGLSRTGENGAAP